MRLLHVISVNVWTQVDDLAWKQSEVSSQLANGPTNYRHCYFSIRIPEPEERSTTSGRARRDMGNANAVSALTSGVTPQAKEETKFVF